MKTSMNTERMLGLVVLALLLLGCLWVLRPFVTAFLWAVVLCFSTWPVYRRLLGGLKNRKTLAALVMTLAMMLVVLVPFVIVGVTLAENVKELTVATEKWLNAGPPAPPGWLGKVPLVGAQAVEYWQSLAQDSAKLIDAGRKLLDQEGSKLLEAVKDLIKPAGTWLATIGLAMGRGVLELTLSIFIAFFLFRDGVAAAERLTNAVSRLGGDRGRHLLEVAGNTVRGVVYGILGTALVQAVMAGIGFFIAGVPGAAFLALLTFFFSVVPMGPPLIWGPAALWLFHEGSSGWGIFMLVWGLGVSSVDNVVKPWLISQGSAMPFILIFFGVLGGALAFGFIGVFLGPTLLAVGFRLVEEWMAAKRAEVAGQTTAVQEESK